MICAFYQTPNLPQTVISRWQACQQYISIAIYLFIAINIFIIALFSILQYIIAAKKLQYYCNILQKYVSIRVYMYIVGLTRD